MWRSLSLARKCMRDMSGGSRFTPPPATLGPSLPGLKRFARSTFSLAGWPWSWRFKFHACRIMKKWEYAFVRMTIELPNPLFRQGRSLRAVRRMGSE